MHPGYLVGFRGRKKKRREQTETSVRGALPPHEPPSLINDSSQARCRRRRLDRSDNAAHTCPTSCSRPPSRSARRRSRSTDARPPWTDTPYMADTRFVRACTHRGKRSRTCRNKSRLHSPSTYHRCRTRLCHRMVSSRRPTEARTATPSQSRRCRRSLQDSDCANHRVHYNNSLPYLRMSDTRPERNTVPSDDRERIAIHRRHRRHSP